VLFQFRGIEEETKFFHQLLGDVMSLFGFEPTNYIMALLVTLPAALGLPLSALHLGRPFLALTAMRISKHLG
jgi:hypothetical protein